MNNNQKKEELGWYNDIEEYVSTHDIFNIVTEQRQKEREIKNGLKEIFLCLIKEKKKTLISSNN